MLMLVHGRPRPRRSVWRGWTGRPSPPRGLQTEGPAAAPFRKSLKDAARRRQHDADADAPPTTGAAAGGRDKWELTVGIEVHAELNTARKLFSRAATCAGDTPNRHVALCDAAFPGSQPRLQAETLVPALRAALALNCTVQARSSFDRKHYFYADQPAGYQITQYYEPLARHGHVTLHAHDFPPGTAPPDCPMAIGIKQVQLEQDTAKTLRHPPSAHLLDFNRVSHPLVEIITLPHIHHPTVAAVCVRKIQAILRSVGACTAGMDVGGLRADVNVSVRHRPAESPDGTHAYHGLTGLGQRTEIKNLASLKAVQDAIIAERDRQIALLESGGAVEGETRGWTLGSKTTKRLRGKEGEVDYRYMPDPDIAPVLLDSHLISHLHRSLPILPDTMIETLTLQYGLTVKDAATLVSIDDGHRLDYFLDVLSHLQQHLPQTDLASLGKTTGNWVLMELGSLFKHVDFDHARVAAADLASMITHLHHKTITSRSAKNILAMKFDGDRRPVRQIIEDDHLELKPLSEAEYVHLAQKLLTERPNMVKDIVEKKHDKKIMWFVGQMMATSAEGSVEPAVAERVLREQLEVQEATWKKDI
ncbi:hypothetical protein ACEQ8H_003657 [Pleosporales sp. CAS-2024a]